MPGDGARHDTRSHRTTTEGFADPHGAQHLSFSLSANLGKATLYSKPDTLACVTVHF